MKYVGKQHAQHLIENIQEDYTVEVDWAGELYCGIKLAWDYEKYFVDIAMPTYVGKQLTRYDHPHKQKQHTPYAPAPVVFGRAAQDLPPADESPPLNDKRKKRVQQVVGSFLY